MRWARTVLFRRQLETQRCIKLPGSLEIGSLDDDEVQESIGTILTRINSSGGRELA
jgi:hypothetical protein